MSGRGSRVSRHIIDSRRLNPYPRHEPGPYPRGAPGPYPHHEPGPYPRHDPGPYPRHEPGPYPRREPNPYSRGAPGPYSPGRPGPPVALRSHSSLLAEELEKKDAELRLLESDRRALVNDRMALERQLAEDREEAQRLSLVVAEIREDKDGYLANLHEKGRRLERELMDTDMLREEVKGMRIEMERHAKGRMELGAKIDMIKRDIQVAKSENKKIPILRQELDAINQELNRTRNAAEMDKKANMTMVEQKVSMEKNMVKMSREIEKLRADLANSEGRQWGPPAVGGPYGPILGSPPSSFIPSYPHLGISERAYGSGSDHNRHSYR